MLGHGGDNDRAFPIMKGRLQSQEATQEEEMKPAQNITPSQKFPLACIIRETNTVTSTISYSPIVGNLTQRLYSHGGISTCSRGCVRSPSALRPLGEPLTQLTTSGLVVCCVTHNIAKSGVKSNFTRFHPLTADDQLAGRLLCEGCCEGSHS